MANPTQGDVHINRPLTNILIAYMQNPDGFVADQVFPNVPVQKQSDMYWKYDRSDWWRDGFRKRADGTESAGGGWKMTQDTYFAHVWGLHKDIGDQTRSNADDPIDLDRDATRWLGMQALLNRENNFVTNFFSTGVWANEVSGDPSSPGANNVLQWNDDNSTPIADVKTRNDTVAMATGMRPNTLVIGRQVWTKLSEHPDILDRIKFSSSNTSPAIITKQAVAAIFEIDKILVMDGVQTTTAENPAFETSMTNAFIGGKNALLVYAAPRPSMMMPSGGYTFSWTGYLGAGNQGQRIKRFRIDTIGSDRVECEMAYVQKAVCTDCGYFFEGIVA